MSQRLDLSRAIRVSEAVYRERSRFDFEKVFWNSAYGVGIVGLGWVAVKLGKMIRDVQLNWDEINSKIADVVPGWTAEDYEYYELTVVYVEGEFKDMPPPSGGIWPGVYWNPEFWDRVEFYRSDPEAYAEYKARFQIAEETVKAGLEEAGASSGVLKVLDVADGIYTRLGPVMPLGIVTYNTLAEVIRVRRLKEEVED